MGILKPTFAAGLLVFAMVARGATPTSCAIDDSAVIDASLAYESAHHWRLRGSQTLVLYDELVAPESAFLQGNEIDGVAARSLIERTTHVLRLETAPNVKEIVFVPSSEVTKIFGSKPRSGEGAWKDFYSKFPNARGLISMSAPGYNLTKCTAVVYVLRQSGVMASEGKFVTLRFDGGRWVVKRSIRAWVS
jgi:hypothetical protein